MIVTEGWVSDQFGVRERAAVLIAKARGRMPLNLGWHFSPSHLGNPGTGSDPEQVTLV